MGAGQAGCGEGWVALHQMHSLLISWSKTNMRTLVREGDGGTAVRKDIFVPERFSLSITPPPALSYHVGGFRPFTKQTSGVTGLLSAAASAGDEGEKTQPSRKLVEAQTRKQQRLLCLRPPRGLIFPPCPFVLPVTSSGLQGLESTKTNEQVKSTRADSLTSLRDRIQRFSREQSHAAAAGRQSMLERTAAGQFFHGAWSLYRTRSYTSVIGITARSAVYKPIRVRSTGCGLVNISNGLGKGEGRGRGVLRLFLTSGAHVCVQQLVIRAAMSTPARIDPFSSSH
ncbi:hypothetical protein Q8A73_007148 [Channa argus]|nr:hypothetical protein Q8A73_007148 [Channa argus]